MRDLMNKCADKSVHRIMRDITINEANKIHSTKVETYGQMLFKYV